ncbi:NAD(P)-dependent oxidoreductase [Actinoplanes bogorensis]|uniref:NAD(P)-dependent oxidoreductase n=1 Tax=Paractinoplanes bogorensis TaxID=1610840 RepID=A0ABS5YVU0_9ACTN|nr:NAD(P)-dependent oxidoreductase [Actinoplanes bogorensis]MBU2667191.1 NAD(P)-dependent oxidoreductase [Actinoplanes bogorensis]
MSTILVTGATGVIGAVTVAQLIDQGHEVVGLDLYPQPGNLGAYRDQVEIVAGDVTDLSLLLQLIRSRRVTRVLHLAAFLSAESLTDPTKSVKVNTIGTGAVLDAARALDVERTCIASTISVMGPAAMYGGKVTTEDDPPSPTTPYGVSKLASEIVARKFREGGLDVNVIRPAVTYGLGRFTSLSGLLNAVVRDVALGRKAVFPPWPGGPERGKLQTIYAKDMAATFVAGVLGPRTENMIFNAPTSEVHSVPEAVQVLRDLVPDADITIDQAVGTSVDEFPLIDGSRARTELGVVPKYTLADGFAEMISFFRAAE